VIGYPSRQDGATLPAQDTGFVPQGKLIMLWCFIPYNKSFIDQACSVMMAGYWPRSFAYLKELRQYPAILTSRLVNNPYVIFSALLFPIFMICDFNMFQRKYGLQTRSS